MVVSGAVAVVVAVGEDGVGVCCCWKGGGGGCAGCGEGCACWAGGAWAAWGVEGGVGLEVEVWVMLLGVGVGLVVVVVGGEVAHAVRPRGGGAPDGGAVPAWGVVRV